MNALRLAVIVLPVVFLVACGTSGTTSPIERGTTIPLHNFAKNGEAKMVASFLDGGADIEARNEKGAAPLHVATQYNTLEVVALLLDRGANIESRMEKGGTPLHVAAGYNEPEVVVLLLDRGADIEARTDKGTTPLHFAAAHNKPEVVALLLDRGADIESREYDGPLQVHPKGLLLRTLLVSLTLAIEAWEFSRDKEGWKPNKEAVVDSFDGPDMIYRIGRHTPLHYAAGYNKPEVVALLLDRGADIYARSTIGSTPLHFAAAYNTPEVVALLLDRGAPFDALDNGDFTPLDYAKDNERLKGSSALERLKATRERIPIIFEPSTN